MRFVATTLIVVFVAIAAVGKFMAYSTSQAGFTSVPIIVVEVALIFMLLVAPGSRVTMGVLLPYATGIVLYQSWSMMVRWSGTSCRGCFGSLHVMNKYAPIVAGIIGVCTAVVFLKSEILDAGKEDSGSI